MGTPIAVPPGAGILDSHVHAWRCWPYPPLVPDPDSRGRVEQLLWEMDAHGVEEAVVVCAGIQENPDNVEYAASAVARWPDRLRLFADIDCVWSPTYHQPGAAARLEALMSRYELTGLTHYVGGQNDGWLVSDEGFALFEVAADHDLVVSLAASPAWQGDLRQLAEQFPTLPILCHHLAGIQAGRPADLDEVVASASKRNILIKASGFHYCSVLGWDYPWTDALEILHILLDAYGPQRVCWGSDFPASRLYCTYKQSLEAVRTHCLFLDDSARAWVLGGALREILATRRPPETSATSNLSSQ